MLNACTKETETLQSPALANKNVALQIKEYYPPEEVDVTEKVESFLEYTKTFNPNNSFKTETEFKDMEVNEAMWTLEAASNYLVNKNFKYEADLDKEALFFNFEFSTFKRDGSSFIKGEDLTKQFDQFISDIKRKAKEKNKLPKLVDMNILKLSNTEAHVNVEISLTTTKLLSFKIPSTSSCDHELCSNGDCSSAWNYSNCIFDCTCDIQPPPVGNFAGGLYDLIASFRSCINTQISFRNQNYWFINVEKVSSNLACEDELDVFTGTDTGQDHTANYEACENLITYFGTRHIESDNYAWRDIAQPAIDKINDEICSANLGFRAVVGYEDVQEVHPPGIGYSAWDWWAITSIKTGIVQQCDNKVCW